MVKKLLSILTIMMLGILMFSSFSNPSKPTTHLSDGLYYANNIFLTIHRGRYTYVDDTVIRGKLEKDLEYDNLYYIGKEPNLIYIRDNGNGVLQLSYGLYADYIWTLDKMDRTTEYTPIPDSIHIEECSVSNEGQGSEEFELFEERYFKETTFRIEGTYTIDSAGNVLCADLDIKNLTGERLIEVNSISFEEERRIFIKLTFYRVNSPNVIEGSFTFRINL